MVAGARRGNALLRGAGATLLVVAVGCVVGMGRRQVDSSWAPLQTAAQLAAMAPTMVPHTELQMQLPRFDIRQQVLPSGLRVGVETGETRGMVAVVTIFGSGSGADPPDHEGIAHLVEHLVYHAHGKAERPESDRLVRMGAHYNAGTTLNLTQFYEVAPAAALPALLELVGERIQRPLAGVDEADFERERAIVENELAQRTETGVYGQVITWMQAAFFPPGHPFARPIGGNRATLHRLTLADARAFVAEHYRPSNVALLVTGAPTLTPARVAARLPDAVTVPGGAAPRPAGGTVQPAASTAAVDSPTGRPPVQARPDTLTGAVALPEIWLAYDLGGGGYDTAVAKILVSRAAETAVRDRLMPEREVLDVDFHAVRLAGRTVLACQIQLENDRRRGELAARARDLIWRLWSNAPPPDVANAANSDRWTAWEQNPVLDLRQAALADAIFAAEPFVDRALERALAFQATGAVEAYDRVLATIASVRPSDLSGRAYQLLSPERARTLFLDPVAEAQRAPPGPVGVAGSDNQPLAMTRLRAADLGAPPRVPPPAGLTDAKVMTLLNGLTVVLAPRPQFPSVTALLGFHGGAASMPPGVLEVMRIVEPELAKSRSANRLEVVHADGRGFTADFVRTDRRRLSNALFSLADRLRMVAETDWALLLARAQAQLRRTYVDPHYEPRAVGAMRVMAALYGPHPYGRRVGVPDLLGLEPQLAPQWLPRLYNPRNGFLVVVGDFDATQAAQLVAGWFGGWQARPDAGRLAAPPVPGPDRRPTPQVFITHRPVTSQAEVLFACRLAYPTTGRERVAEDVIEGLLGGTLSSQIREQAGAAYSIDSATVSYPGGAAHLVVTMSVDTRRLRDALRVLHGEIDALAAGRIDKGAFNQVRWGLARKAGLEYQTGLDAAAQIVGGFTLGLPLETLASDADELGRVSERDVTRIFAPCATSQVLSLIGDEPTIRASM